MTFLKGLVIMKDLLNGGHRWSVVGVEAAMYHMLTSSTTAATVAMGNVFSIFFIYAMATLTGYLFSLV